MKKNKKSKLVAIETRMGDKYSVILYQILSHDITLFTVSKISIVSFYLYLPLLILLDTHTQY